MWPDCTIKTAVYMKAMLQKATFSTHVVRILDVGDRTTVQKHKTNLIRYGEISPSKERRKELKAKKIIGKDNSSMKKLSNCDFEAQNSSKNISLGTTEPKVILQEISTLKELENSVNIDYGEGLNKIDEGHTDDNSDSESSSDEEVGDVSKQDDNVTKENDNGNDENDNSDKEIDLSDKGKRSGRSKNGASKGTSNVRKITSRKRKYQS